MKAYSHYPFGSQCRPEDLLGSSEEYEQAHADAQRYADKIGARVQTYPCLRQLALVPDWFTDPSPVDTKEVAP